METQKKTKPIGLGCYRTHTKTLILLRRSCYTLLWENLRIFLRFSSRTRTSLSIFSLSACKRASGSFSATFPKYEPSGSET